MERYHPNISQVREDRRRFLPTSVAELSDCRNVPGVAVYFYTLSAIRNRLSAVPYFSITVPVSGSKISSPSGQVKKEAGSRSAIVKLSSGGNLLAGAVGRTSVGFVLSPITVIKARFEVYPWFLVPHQAIDYVICRVTDILITTLSLVPSLLCTAPMG